MFKNDKKIIFLILLLFAMTILVVFLLKTKKRVKDNIVDDERKEYEILVSVKNQVNSDPVEDRRTSIKRGYVLGIYNPGHTWSDTEKNGYLILKMNLTDKEKEMLIMPVKEKEGGNGEKNKINEDLDGVYKIVSMRKYRINLEKVGYKKGDKLTDRHLYKDKVFDWGVVEKVE